jgi:O-antigen ligase
MWFVLLGGTELGSLSTQVRAINAVIGAAIVGYWLWQVPRRADRADLLVIGALVAFLVACVASDYRRMSIEAGTSALAFAAAFSVARWEVADRRAARALVTVLGACALVLILIILPLWASVWAGWMAITGSVPPLNLILPVGPYRGFHVVAILFALLLPSLVLLARRRLVNVVAYVGIVLSLALIYVTGSRTVWLALALSVVPVVFTLGRRSRRVTTAAVGVAFVALAGLAVTGVLGVIVGRLATTSTIDLRLEIWSNSLQLWLADPLFGSGPGSFSAAFTFSDYFVQYERVGRHADNAVVQLLMEGGLMGMATLGLLMAALVVGVRQARGRYPRVALMGVAIFAFTSLTDNPSDTANLVVIGLCWAALCTPAAETRPAMVWAPSWRTVAAGIAALVVAGASGAMLAASSAFDAAQSAARSGDTDAAIRALERSVALDPGHAMYWRERGLHRSSAGEPGAASDLERALILNPADTATIRALAVLSARAGEVDVALDLASRAADLRPTDEVNLTTLALVGGMTGREPVAAEALTELLRRMPWIAASSQWPAHFPTATDLEELQTAAADAWKARRESSARFALPQVWLDAAVDGDGAALRETIGWDLPYLHAVDRLLRCDVDGAEEAIFEPPPASPHESELLAMILVARVTQADERLADAIALADLRNAAEGRYAVARPEPESPFWDPAEDRRLYERDAVVPVGLGLQLPTAAEGLSAWLMDPSAAARAGAPGSRLADCGLPGQD